MSRSRLRARLEPNIRQAQKIRINLLKYGGLGAGLIALIITVVTIYGNLGFTEDSLANAAADTFYSGAALKFDGVNDFVSLGSVKDNWSNTFTVMSWVKWDILPANGNPWASIFSINSSTASDQGIFWLQHNQNNSRFEFAVQSVTGRNYVQSVSQVKKDTWYHVAGVYDGNTIKLFVNGVEEASTGLTGLLDKPDKSFELTIGEWADKGWNYRRFTGVLDEVSAWDYPMTATDIVKYMTQKVPEKEKGLILNMNFDEGSGTTSGSSNNSKYKGTITGSDWVASGAPISAESMFMARNLTNLYSHTFSNGYTLTINNLSKNPTGVLFYFINEDVANSPSYAYSDYTFQKGIMGVYVFSPEPLTYNAVFAEEGMQTLSTNNSQYIVLTRPSTDLGSWTKASDVALANQFTFASTPSSRFETAVGERTTPLPIVLEYFRGKGTEDNKVLLTWATSSEKNNDFFTLERSRDGKTFETITTLPGAGNSTKKLLYSFTDDHPENGLNYYRLKQTDFDKKFEYSPLISVTATAPEAVTPFTVNRVYPNPFVDNLTVELTAPGDEHITIRLTGGNGNVVHEESVEVVSGHNTLPLQLTSQTEKGIYLLTIIRSGESPKAVRVIKN